MSTDTLPDMNDPEIRKLIDEINSSHINIMEQVRSIQARVTAGEITRAEAGKLTGALMVKNAMEQRERFSAALRKHNIDMPIIG